MMERRSGDLLSRVGIALVGAPAVLALIWAGGWWLFALATVAGVVALDELWRMTRSLRPLAIAGYAGAALALVGAELGGVDTLLAGFVATFPLAFLLKGVAETKTTTTVSVSATVLGAGWVGLGLGFLLLLRDLPEHGVLVVVTVLLAVWANDTLAYFAGRAFGRHRLAPLVSPGKTWEGFAAGTVASIAVAFFAMYDQGFLEIWQAIVLGVVIAIAGPVGDLFESAVKRDMQVKDTGRVLGSHGGMLDRIDALLFAAAAAYFLLDAFNRV
ncbi:MAG TPA: phosphatidate cytidylyltransferase [Gaiellaceae bacterium]|nr:phosphatidate cytidylyltransferase [Gaiellaceae bacterium]